MDRGALPLAHPRNPVADLVQPPGLGRGSDSPSRGGGRQGRPGGGSRIPGARPLGTRKRTDPERGAPVGGARCSRPFPLPGLPRSRCLLLLGPGDPIHPAEHREDRGRFDAAHELGHLVLHGEEQMPHGPQAEAEAHRFAAAFLMPRADILAHVPHGASTSWILQAKRRWKVAAMALAHRLHELGLTTEWQYRTHCVELGRLGDRKSEPRSGVARETSQVLGKVFTALRREGTRLPDVARELHLRPADLNDLIFGLVVTAQEGEGQRHSGADNRPRLSVVR
ncbi:ImmA/IrrE family metallo-endopeptidase [Streptomyces sp. SA15]|uniref:ImmA/IrrE family metallo-endopeptidase n=1 Tax=Streptomyces sp. SA15 TaxID=934019 RepID=UPI0027BACC48|nr:ImmA/IrrE family metallo-endopeptidase [Streptomyces sp. SA15]